MATEVTNRRPLRIFYSYSRRDERFREQLETHLALLQRQGFIQEWHDRKIGAGQEWKHAIDDHLEQADIILLLVSADFLASPYCYDIEMTRALERHEAGQATVIPIILRPVDWHSAPFAKLQALPTDARPIIEWSSRDRAWLAVAQGIREAIRELTPQATPSTPRATPSKEPQKPQQSTPESDHADVWKNKGNVLVGLWRYEEALAVLDEALRLRPDHADAWYNKGLALAELGRHEEALAAYEQALRLRPNDADAWYNKGEVLAELGRYKEALVAQKQAQRLRN